MRYCKCGMIFVLLLFAGCRSAIGVREAPVKQWLKSPPAPLPAKVQTPVTVGIVASDARPQYSPGLLPAALFIPIIPYVYGSWQGVPVENCLTFPGTWGSGTEVAADYVHLISYMTADALRRSGAVVHAAYPSNAAVLRQYELILRLDFEDFYHGEGLFTYGIPPILGVPFVLWALGLPRGYVGAGGAFTWQLYEQCSGTVLASGRIEDGESTLTGFYYGGGGFPTAVSAVNRLLLSRVVKNLETQVVEALAQKSPSYFEDLIRRHRVWRSKRR